MTQDWTGWAAGLFEGEGSIYASKREENGHKYAYPMVQLSSTDLDVLQRFHEVVGTGSISGPYQKAPNRKPIWSWHIRSRVGVTRLIQEWWPYLGERRRAKCEEVLAEVAALARRRVRNAEGKLVWMS